MWFGVLELYVFTHDESGVYRMSAKREVLDLYIFAHNENKARIIK